MHWQYNPYVLPLFITAAISAAIAFFAWQRRPAPGARPLGYLMLAVCEWSLGYAVGMASADLSAKVFWAKVQYFGIVSVPILWLFLALQYTGRESWLTRRNWILLAIMPFVTLLLAWTNESHGLIWSDIRLDTSGSFSVLYLSYGAFVWVWVMYSYPLILLGSVLLLRAVVRSPHLYRQQAAAMLIAALAPWVGNVLRISGLNPFPHLDVTNFAFTLSGVVTAWALFRFRLLDIVPVARDAVIENMDDGVIVLDTQNRIVDINPAAGRVLGCSVSEVIGQPAAQVFAPDLVERYRDAMPVLRSPLSLTKGGIEGEAQGEIVLGKGEAQRIFDLCISPLYDRRGRLTGRLVVSHDITVRKRAEEALRKAHDELETRIEERTAELAKANEELRVEITERKRAEEALRRREQEIRTIAENVPALVSYVDAEGCYRFVNKRYEEWFGVPRTEIVGKHYRQVLGEATYEQIRDHVEAALSGQRVSYEEALAYARGGTRWVMADYVPDADDGGRVTGFFALVTDITERKRAEKALQRQREELQTILDSVPASILYKDEKNRFIRVNKTCAEVLGRPKQEIEGKSCSEIFPPDQAEAFWRDDKEVIASGHPKRNILEPVETTEGTIWVQTDKIPYRDEKGNIIGVIGFAIDITERKKAEEALRRRNEELAALNAITAAVSRSLDLQEILNQALDKVLEITGMEAGSMYLMDPQAEELVLATYRGVSEEFADAVRTFKMGESLSGRAGQSGEPIVKDDLTGDPRVTTTLVSEEGIRSFAAIPTKSKEKVQGVMNIASHQVHPFSPQEIQLYTAIANQIGVAIENARLFEQVQAGRDRLRRLTEQVVSAQEEERKRIAQELHDELGQALTGIGFDLAAIKRELPPEVAPTVRQKLVETRSLVARADERVSELALDLRPYMLDDLGLVSALRWYANRYAKRLDIEVDMEAIDFQERLTAEVETALYRVVQEALTNVAKHAQADRVRIRLERKETSVTATVEDDGQGFDVETIAGPAAPQRGAGLLGIQERANFLGGTLSIESTPGQGTRLTIEVPV